MERYCVAKSSNGLALCGKELYSKGTARNCIVKEERGIARHCKGIVPKGYV